jgi:hypothetical protein
MGRRLRFNRRNVFAALLTYEFSSWVSQEGVSVSFRKRLGAPAFFDVLAIGIRSGRISLVQL